MGKMKFNLIVGLLALLNSVTFLATHLQAETVLSGFIVDLATGVPIQGATITAVERSWFTYSGPNGQYFLTINPDTAWTIRVEHSPTHFPASDTIIIAENDTLFRDYFLEPKVPVTLTALFANPADASYRYFFVNGTWDDEGRYGNWSDNFDTLRDDGVAPDPIAGDGAFTGQILLARDLAHSYQWAIYWGRAEYYRLQHGSGFQIPEFEPPNVPPLQVNPCGNDNRWGFSVYMNDGDLEFDLIRGYMGRPYSWAQAAYLEDGVTYAFRFRAMHCDSASVPPVGQEIVFECSYSAYYEFIVNERSLEYSVLLKLLEPPGNIWAQGGLDGHVPVSWLPPGVGESQEIRYDDGVLTNSYYYFGYDNLAATMFTVPAYVFIDSVMVHVLTEGDQYWPWPDDQHNPVGVFIFRDDGTGYPQSDPVFYTEATAQLGQWIRVDVPEIPVQSGENFWVAMNNLEGGGEDGIGIDAFTDYPAHKWAREGGNWFEQDYYSGDHMIRAKVIGLTDGSWLGMDSPAAAGVRPDRPVASNIDLVTCTSEFDKVDSIIKNDNFIRTVYYPQISSTRPDLILNTQQAGYRLYRSVWHNPFSGGDSNLVNGPDLPGDLIVETEYDDWVRWDGTDSIQNGRLYYYQVTAVYQVVDSMGNPTYIEGEPSGMAWATPEEQPPEPPTNLRGHSVGDDVYLTWTISTSYDVEYYDVWRRIYGDDEFFHAGTVFHPDSTLNEIDVDPGTWRYFVISVDDEGMISIGHSNYAEIRVGSEPPRNLQVSTDEEYQISLWWESPSIVPDSFKIYKADTSSGIYRVIHEQPGDDSAQFVDAPVPNGQSFFYYVTAVYPWHEETARSNIARGIAMNHPPANPTNLSGYAISDSVYLTWNSNTDYDIMEYRVFRRNYNEQEFNLVGTVTHPDTTFDEILSLEGIHRYKIAAVDDENMQSEGYSNPVDIAIGNHMHPEDLRASRDREGRIDLRWNHARIGTGGCEFLIIAADEADILIDELYQFNDVCSITYWDARDSTPTLDGIQPYSCAIVWSHEIFQDPVGIGDLLYDYVNNGGAVVLGQFCFTDSLNLQGRFMDHYSSFLPGPTVNGRRSLGQFDTIHPLMDSVQAVTDTMISAVNFVRGELVASYDDGTPFVGAGAEIPVVCVNGYIGDSRQFTGDMITLIHNAMNFYPGSGLEPRIYKVFRADNPSGPFALIDTLPGEETRYADGPLPNGVPYYYYLTGVHSDFGESEPSNIAWGIAVNHPPANPTNLSGYAISDSVYLTWNRNTDYDIIEYRIFRRNYNEQEFNLVGTVTHPDTTFDEILSLDGIHRYKIASVDDENMQSEGFSNYVDIPIGAIPPADLRASTDLENRIELRGRPPEYGNSGLGDVLVIAADEADLFIDELLQYDDVTSVTFWDGRITTPTLDNLQPYDCAIVWTHEMLLDPVEMGNVLANYVDVGGAVVLTQHCFDPSSGLSGRIMQVYSPFDRAEMGGDENCLGDYAPGHCIMEGITDVCDTYWANVDVINNGELVASYANGVPLVAINPNFPVGAVNGYVGNDREFSGDMPLLIHNTAACASSSGIIPEAYNIYKSENEHGPFSIIHSQPGIGMIRFIDIPVPNGVPFYYFVTAVYPGPDESDPSNIARGIAVNYPPPPPFDLSATVNGRVVTLAWSSIDSVGDRDHFTVYQREISDTVWTEAGAPIDSVFAVTIPEGQDGYYAFAVTAIDTGLPPLESDFSNIVVVLIGEPPPGCYYMAGDINSSGQANGIDVTFGVRYLKGGESPPYLCECTPGNVWFVAGDVNGNCIFNGVDITFFVSYLKGFQPSLLFCADCPPVELAFPAPAILPGRAPTTKNRMKVNADK